LDSIEEEVRSGAGRVVDLRPFKSFVQRNYPAKWHLRELILMEDDVIPGWVFIAYVKLWLRLLDLELRDHKKTGSI
jgi:hypothetical protein